MRGHIALSGEFDISTRRGGESNLIPAPPPLTPTPPAGLIEIILTTGTTLRVDAQVDPRALRRVLAVLRG